MGRESDSTRRGFLATITGVFWAAAAALFGSSSTSCVAEGDDDVEPDGGGDGSTETPREYGDSTCYVHDAGTRDDAYVPPRDDAYSGCYADADADTYWTPPEDAVEDDGKDPQTETMDGDDPEAEATDAEEADADATEPSDTGESSDAGTTDGEPADAELPEGWAALTTDDRRKRLRWARRTVERTKAVRLLLADPRTDPAVRAALRSELRPLRRWTATARRWLRATKA